MLAYVWNMRYSVIREHIPLSNIQREDYIVHKFVSHTTVCDRQLLALVVRY